MITIENSVPVPAKIRTRTGKYPWATMNVGDSFIIPDGIKAVNVRASMYKAQKDFAGAGKKFHVGNDENGVLRAWRRA